MENDDEPTKIVFGLFYIPKNTNTFHGYFKWHSDTKNDTATYLWLTLDTQLTSYIHIQNTITFALVKAYDKLSLANGQ